jgi:hypothetical protein|tara:strand:+ start:63 stop:647 length:585 start_codon:yes stop_codon:yes gene_type:complete
MLSNVKDELNRFAKYVISQSRANLTKGSKPFGTKNDTKKLYNSLKHDLNVSPNSFGLKFLMEDYGAFLDQGVKGKDPSKVSPNAKIKGQQAPNSKFRFGSGSASGKWDEFTGGIEKWAKKKNIRFRDEKGKFKKGNYKSLAYVIASNIYNRGIKPSMFFTKPFKKAFDNLPKDIVEAYKLDVEELIKYTTNGNN